MNRIEEKLYLEIVLDCESCGELFEPESDACDPMDKWAKINEAIAIKLGWHSNQEGNTFCKKCVGKN